MNPIENSLNINYVNKFKILRKKKNKELIENYSKGAEIKEFDVFLKNCKLIYDNNNLVLNKKYSKAIFTIGKSVDPIIYSLYILLKKNSKKSVKIYFIVSEETKDFADIIKYFIKSIFDFVEFSYKKVIPHNFYDQIDVYCQIIKDCFSFGTRKIYCDITGGKKVMSSSLAAISILYNLDLFYIYWDYKKIESTELRLLGLENIKEQVLYEELLSSYENKNFDYILYKCSKIKDIKNKNLLDLCSLSKLYIDLINFRVRDISKYKLNYLKNKENFNLLLKNINLLSKIKSIESVYSLKIHEFLSLLRFFLDLANNFNKSHTDKSIIYSYRIIELICQYLLMKSYGINTSELSNDLVEKYNENAKQIQKMLGYDNPLGLNRKIGLVSSYVLLYLLENENKKYSINLLNRKLLNKIFRISNIRNNLFIEHGFNSAGEKSFKLIYGLANDLYNSLLDIFRKEMGSKRIYGFNILRL